MEPCRRGDGKCFEAAERSDRSHKVDVGRNYWVEIEHPILSHVPLLGRFTGPGRHPLTGDHYTVKAGDRNFGSSERLTWNFADFDEAP